MVMTPARSPDEPVARGQAEPVLTESSKAESQTARALYVATRRKSAQLNDLFESMRDDMANAMPVELIVDRRSEEQCAWSGNGATERRHAPDRRAHGELNALARNGWARIVVGPE